MLKYTLYVWTEEAFRQWKQGPYGPGGDNDPASFEMYDVSEDEVKKQLAEYYGCDIEDVYPSYDGDWNTNDGLPNTNIERAFGMAFWDVAYPDGIGSYLVVLNRLEE